MNHLSPGHRSGLSSIDWDLHHPPWRHLLLIPDGSDSWRMRSEEREEAGRGGQADSAYRLGLDELDDEAMTDLREDWARLLLPALEDGTVDGMWQTALGE